MRKIIIAIALLSLLGQTAQAAENIPTPASQGITVGTKQIAPLVCHINPSSGVGECLPTDALDAAQSPVIGAISGPSISEADRIMGLVPVGKASISEADRIMGLVPVGKASGGPVEVGRVYTVGE